GSGAGSVAAYALGITNIDPLKYDLLFERFLNPERVSMPDIDIDFDDRGRGKVIDYVVEKYGRESVCQIVTFGTMGSKSVIRDVSRVLGVPLAEADRIAAVVFTSGTTGAPQPNYKRWGQLLEGARRAEAGLALPADCGLVATVPPQHMFGLEMSVMLPLATGRRVLPERPFFPGDIAAALARIEGPRVLFTTPLHLRACLREEGIRWPAIHRIVVSTAPLSVELAAEAERRTGSPVIEIYGSSETGAMATRATAHTEEWRCLDGLSLREEEGVVRVGGGHVPEPVTLNDAVELCSPTTFRLLGRGEDLVDVAGKRASLGGLGEILRGIDGVEDGVFLQPSGAEGEAARLIALVVAPGVGEEAIRRELRRWVDPVFLPRPLYKVESLPRNELGKLPRQALQELMDRMGER
ncbi:MAG: AMP-binding protein, partial [Thiohalospira sp.]